MSLSASGNSVLNSQGIKNVSSVGLVINLSHLISLILNFLIIIEMFIYVH